VIHLYFEWDFEAARRRLERALTLSPHHSMLRHMYADYLMAQGRLEESLEQVRIGRSYDPMSRLANMVFLFHTLATRRYDETIVEARRALKDFPDARWAHARIAEALWYQGRHEEALPEQKLALGDDPHAWEAFEQAFRRGGPRAAMKARADQLVPAAAGERDAALAWLEKAHALRLPQLLHVPGDPAFDGMREDPRFEALMRKIGIPARVVPR
jgi:serine/threonine-protein kinase